MEKNIYITAVTALCFVACSGTKIAPIESVKTEYRDNYVRDSIVCYDSVFVKQKADTVFFERYRYLYRDKIIRDSVFINDTIRIPYRVEVVKAVKAPLSGWQNFQVWCGRITLGIVLMVMVYFVLKWKRKLSF